MWCVSHIIDQEEGRSGLRALNDTPYDGFKCVDDGGWDLKSNVVPLCGISQMLYVILIVLYVSVGVDIVVLVRKSHWTSFSDVPVDGFITKYTSRQQHFSLWKTTTCVGRYIMLWPQSSTKDFWKGRGHYCNNNPLGKTDSSDSSHQQEFDDGASISFMVTFNHTFN